MEIYNFEQRTPEWYEIRKGLMTASKSSTIQANGKGLETYILEIMAEYYSSAEKESYTNDAMQRGIELESEARLTYEIETNCKVDEVGFVVYNNYFGASPDGFVGDDGLLEIKCPTDKTYLELLLNGDIKKEYYDQMQGQMLATNRQWTDYFVYNPNFEKSFVLKRVQRDDEVINKILQGIKKGSELIEKINKAMKEV